MTEIKSHLIVGHFIRINEQLGFGKNPDQDKRLKFVITKLNLKPVPINYRIYLQYYSNIADKILIKEPFYAD
ncbi:MAG: hypothetical protein AB3A66_26890 [Nodularia sp. CChRGM 3473]